MKKTILFLVFLISRISLSVPHQNGHMEFRNSSSSYNNSYDASYDKSVDVAAGFGVALGAYYLITGQYATKKKEQQFAKERNWYNRTFCNYDANDFIKHFGLQPYGWRDWSFEWSVHQDPIFNKFPLYRFSQFRQFLRGSPCYEQRVCQLRQEIKRGKIFEIDGCSHDEFKTVVLEMASRYPYFPEPSYDCSPYNVIVEPSSVPKKEIQKVDPKQAEQALKRDKITKTMQRPENDLMADYAWYQDIEINELAQPLTVQEQFLIKRVEALTEFGQGTISWREETYTISTDVSNLLVAQRIDTQSYTLLYGNQVQHVLHSEILSILGDTAALRYGPIAEECKGVTTTLTAFANAGKLHNEVGHIKDACKFADFCWGMLDCLKEAYAFECELEKAVGRGVLKGGGRFFEKVKDPVKTICDMRNSIRSLGYQVFEFTEDLKYGAYVSLKSTLKETADELIDRLKGEYVAPPVEDKGIKELVEAFECSVDYVSQKIEYAWSNVTRENTLYAAEEGSAIATEMALQHATFSALSSLATNGGTALKEIIDAGHGPLDFMDLPLRVNSIEAAISYEAVIAADRAAAIEAVGKATAAAFNKAAKIAPLTVFSQNDSYNQNRPKFSYPTKDILEVDKQISEADILNYSSTYDDVYSYDGVKIRFRFGHNWNGDVTAKGELGGLHHDMLCYYEDQGLVQKLELFPEDFYSGLAKFRDEWVKKSWFPNKWTVEDVMQSVKETINDPSIVQVNGRVTILEKTRDSGVIIRVVFDNVSGYCFSFYPRFKS